MTYEEALAYIHSTRNFGSKPGLTRIRALMEACGNPQKSVRFVHVTGTNGKGSTTTMIANILRDAGYRTGLFLSPYVDDFRERIQVSGEMIPHEALCEELERLIPAIRTIREQGHTHPTEFELVTALAFNWFAHSGCDIVALEVGLGGRLDCTNIIDAPEAAVFTPVSLDHTKLLGSTTAEIARDKAGIIKPGCDAVTCYGQDSAALAVLRSVCAEKGVRLHVPDADKLDLMSSVLGESKVEYDYFPLTVSMTGSHQIQNAVTAYFTALALRERGWTISDENIRSGIASTRFPGRLEIIRRQPLILLDGGHNPGGADAVAHTIDEYLSGRRIITVMGMCADKNTEYCIHEIARRSSVFIGTQSLIPRALPARDVANAAKGLCPSVNWNAEISKACRIAMELAAPGDVILVCGSLYILHDARVTFSLL